MDRILDKFEKLFSIRIAHDAYPFAPTNGGFLTPHVRINPDPTTESMFRKHAIHYRWKNDILLCFVKIRNGEDAPYFRLPTSFSARFFINLCDSIIFQTSLAANHGKENIYRFRINVRASATSMTLATATLGPIASLEPVKTFNPGNPGSWSTSIENLKGEFGVIDLVTEGSSTHRLYTDVSNQLLFYTSANGNENEHLFTIHLNN